MNVKILHIGAEKYISFGRMGVDPWVDRGHVPLLFEVLGTPCVLPPTFSGIDIIVLMHTVFIG